MAMETCPDLLESSSRLTLEQLLALSSDSPDDPFRWDLHWEKERSARKKNRPLNRTGFLTLRFIPNFEKATFGPLDLYISKMRIVKDPSLIEFEGETLIVTVQRTPQHPGHDLDGDAQTSWELAFFLHQTLSSNLESGPYTLLNRWCLWIKLKLLMIGVSSEDDLGPMIDLLNEDDEDDVKILEQPSIAEVSFNTPPRVHHLLDLESRLAQAEEFEFQPTHTTAVTVSLSQDDTTRPPLYFMSFLLLLESLILLPDEATYGFHRSSNSFWLIMKLFDTAALVSGIPRTIRVNDRSWSSKLLTPLFNIGWFLLIMKLFDTVTSAFGIPQIIRVNDRSWSSNPLTLLFNVGSFWFIMKFFDTLASVLGIPQPIRVNDRSLFSNLLTWLFNMFRRPKTASDPRPPGTIGPFDVMERPSPEKICEYVKNWAEANAEFKDRDEFKMYKHSLQAKIEETEGSESGKEFTSEEE